ncbi:MAG: phosphohydrolase [Lachnospiraceae bacterium]|nr:phosphohydrolase [Lachnospiraceae bacterium]
MKFVRWEDLKSGMRLARPIYSKSGVLLFERNSKLTSAAIDSVKNFGLLGIYILEPAEPLPPMSEEDMEFERFEIKTVSTLQDELEKIITTKRYKNLPTIASQIIRAYGHLEEKVNVYQNLRSRDDFVCRHMFNTAILCAMITHRMNVPLDEQLQTVNAALLHDIGKMKSSNPAIYGGVTDPALLSSLQAEMLSGLDVLEQAFSGDGPALKRICTQAIRNQADADAGVEIKGRKTITGAKILMVANRFDELTGMSLSGESESEVAAIKEFMDRSDVYDPVAVKALIDSIYILFPGVSVVLNTGEKALVLAENTENILKPSVLYFRDNSILDLSLWSNADIWVSDVMKTLDNRYIMDMDALKQVGGGTVNA